MATVWALVWPRVNVWRDMEKIMFVGSVKVIGLMYDVVLIKFVCRERTIC